MRIHVMAAGNGTRMRQEIERLGYGNLPKHLLPTGTPGGETLLLKNIDDALAASSDVALHANASNQDAIRRSVGHLTVPIILSEPGPLGPFGFTDHIPKGEAAASVAGDVYIANPDWDDFLVTHRSSGYPVSLLVGMTDGYDTSAVFDLDPSDGRVDSFHRLTEPRTNVYRNIGMYAFTATPPVLEILQGYQNKPAGQQDLIMDDFVAQRLVRAHVHPDPFFNINNGSDYSDLLAYTQALAGLSEQIAD